jgi:hypothetical protein
MNSYLAVIAILIIGFIVYTLYRDQFFDLPDSADPFHTSIPAQAGIEIRQAPLYPPRTVTASGPHSPQQASQEEGVHVYAPPQAKDPYAESQESSEIPENLRHPERSFRAPPMNDQRQIAVQAGIASPIHQVSSDQAQMYTEEMIQNGGELMPGIFANDTFNDSSFSAF